MPITVSGTQITFNDATVQTTAFTGGGGTVTSVATGNGLTGGTITTSGTLSIAAPSFNTVGSYVFGLIFPNGGSLTSGTGYAAGLGVNQVHAPGLGYDPGTGSLPVITSPNNLSGTWRYMGGTVSGANYSLANFVRVS